MPPELVEGQGCCCPGCTNTTQLSPGPGPTAGLAWGLPGALTPPPDRSPPILAEDWGVGGAGPGGAHCGGGGLGFKPRGVAGWPRPRSTRWRLATHPITTPVTRGHLSLADAGGTIGQAQATSALPAWPTGTTKPLPKACPSPASGPGMGAARTTGSMMQRWHSGFLPVALTFVTHWSHQLTSPVLFYFPKRLLEPANSYVWFTLADRLRRGLVGTHRPPENNQNLELSQLVPQLPREASGGGGWAPEPRRTQLFPTLKARDGVRPRSGKEQNQAQTKRCRSGDDGVAAKPLPDPPRNKGGRGASRP